MGSALDNVSASHQRRRSGVSQWRSGDSEPKAFRAYRMELQIRFSHEVLLPASCLFDRLTRAPLSGGDHTLVPCAKPLCLSFEHLFERFLFGLDLLSKSARLKTSVSLAKVQSLLPSPDLAALRVS
ncbi:MAG: hypothetical protein WBX22_10945 [Silvibacterium sp.]|jgi:hypothetical protein